MNVLGGQQTPWRERVQVWVSSRAGPKARLELLLGFSSLVAGYLYVWVYQNLLGFQVKFVDFYSLLRIPVISAVVFPLIYYLYVKPDPLQRSSSRSRSVVFFQAQFPSPYIRERCQRCVETAETCRNFIGPDSLDHINYWFNDIWREIFARDFKERFDDTFERGYTCKLVSGLQMAAFFFAILGILTMSWRPLYNRVASTSLPFEYLPGYFMFILV